MRISLLHSFIITVTAGATIGDDAAAATFNVTNYSDAIPAPPGSFRAALEAASVAPQNGFTWHTIDFVAPDPGTILPVAPFLANNSIRVFGRNKVTFDSSTAASDAVDGLTLFEVMPSAKFRIEQSILTGGSYQRGIHVGPNGYLDASGITVKNFAFPEDHEPGVGGNVLCDYEDPPLGYTKSTTCLFTNSSIINGTASYGGGIAGIGAVTISIFNSDVSHNMAWAEGGGVFTGGYGSGNTFANSLTLKNSSMYDNASWAGGGAVSTLGVPIVYVINTTLSTNLSYSVGAATLDIDDADDLRIIHSTITDGSTDVSGPGQGAELALYGSNGYVANSVLGRTGAAAGQVCLLGAGNTVSFGTGNKIQDASCGTAATADLGLLGLSTSACTSPPAGLTGCRVHALTSTSPARNTASNTYCSIGHGTTADQRWYRRLGACDAGSYEYGGTP